MNTEQLIEIASECATKFWVFGGENPYIEMDVEAIQTFVARIIELETPRIRAEALQDAAAYALANATIKNSCCAETRASIYTLIKGMD